MGQQEKEGTDVKGREQQRSRVLDKKKTFETTSKGGGKNWAGELISRDKCRQGETEE